ncbi:1100_t:CDS:2, partial [Acaulospora colombiana]
ELSLRTQEATVEETHPSSHQGSYPPMSFEGYLPGHLYGRSGNTYPDKYYHRLLNVPKLVEVKFTSVPRGSTMARMIRQFALPSTPRLMNPEQIAIFNNGSETSSSSQP